jgi:hypothetical protein
MRDDYLYWVREYLDFFDWSLVQKSGGDPNRVPARSDLQLREDGRDVVLDRAGRNVERRGDLAVGIPGAQTFEHVELARG